jgi:zinc/manganese transport system substrate-binding protein
VQRWRSGFLVLVVLACSAGTANAAPAGTGKVSVVAAEDFWGSIARQLGGDHVAVTSIITNPNTDPHDYEAKPNDSAALAGSQVAVVNGIGYDGWATKLLAANPSSSRKVITVGDVVGVKAGGNPHQWYSPSSVNAVIDAITATLKQVDPADASYFEEQKQVYESTGLKRYNDLRAAIRREYQGIPVGASESIFVPLAEDLGLKLLTPESFLDAISEGTDPTAQDKATVDQQIAGRQIKVFVYNTQNSTPDVAALVEKANKAGIPVATVTETLTPEATPFQDWQANQLESLSQALARATGKSASSLPADTAPAPDTAPATKASAAASPPPPAPAPTVSPPSPKATSMRKAADSAPAAAAKPTPAPPLASTGSSARLLVTLAGLALLVGGLGVMGGAPLAGARRRWLI